MALQHSVGKVRRWWWLITVYLAVGASGALTISLLTPPVFAASTTIIVTQGAAGPGANEYNSLMSGERLANTYASLLTKPRLLQSVADELRLDTTPAQLSEQIKVDAVSGTQLIVVTVEDSTPDRAEALANTLVKRFILEMKEHKTAQFAATLESLEQDLKNVQARIDALESGRALGDFLDEPERLANVQGADDDPAQLQTDFAGLLKSYHDVRLAEAANSDALVAPDAVASPNPVRPQTGLNVASAVALALFTGLLVALVSERIDDRILSVRDIVKSCRAPVLGSLAQINAPHAGSGVDVPVLAPTGSLAAEQIRYIRTNLDFASLNAAVKSLLVTSFAPGEGKSTVAANLARSFADKGFTVVLVDANLRRPALARLFSRAAGEGLTRILLRGTSRLSKAIKETGIEGLRLLPSGPLPPNPAEVLQSRRMGTLVQALGGAADMVIFDCAALAGASDASGLAQKCDAVILVAQQGRTTASALGQSVRELEGTGARVLGVVLNGVPSVPSTESYGPEPQSNALDISPGVVLHGKRGAVTRAG